MVVIKKGAQPGSYQVGDGNPNLQATFELTWIEGGSVALLFFRFTSLWVDLLHEIPSDVQSILDNVEVDDFTDEQAAKLASVAPQGVVESMDACTLATMAWVMEECLRLRAGVQEVRVEHEDNPVVTIYPRGEWLALMRDAPHYTVEVDESIVQ